MWEASSPPPLSSLVSGGPLEARGPQELQPKEGLWRGGGVEHWLVLLGGEQAGVDPSPSVWGLFGGAGAWGSHCVVDSKRISLPGAPLDFMPMWNWI